MAQASKSAASEGFTPEERAAMKERAKELRAEAKRDAAKVDSTKDVLAKIDEMPEPDRAMAKRVHEIVTAVAPDLTPKLWYGMPSYARDGQIVCFFQDAAKFKARYATLGFNDAAHLDEGTMWPTAYALTKMTDATEAAISKLVQKAVS